MENFPAWLRITHYINFVFLTLLIRTGRNFLDYLRFQAPSASNFHPYDALQQLTYAFVVFILGPLAILTGAAMSPAIAGRFPAYTKLFGGRQMARSLHFLVLAGYVVFIIIHVTMVALIDFSGNMDRIVLGRNSGHEGLAIFIGLSAIAIVIGINVLLTLWSQKNPRQVQLATGAFIDKTIMDRLKSLRSKQQYSLNEISPYFWANGQLPDSKE